MQWPLLLTQTIPLPSLHNTAVQDPALQTRCQQYNALQDHFQWCSAHASVRKDHQTHKQCGAPEWQQGVAPPNASGLHWTHRTAEHSTGMSSKLGWALGTGNISSPDHKEMGTWPKHHFYSEKNACFTSFCDFPQLIIMKGSIQAFLSHITFLQNRVASVSKRKAVPGFLQWED